MPGNAESRCLVGKRIENWPELQAMYVIHNKSHREIAVYAGSSNSTISVRAKRDDWEGKRLAYKASIAQRSYETAAAVVSNQNSAVIEENILVARAYIRLTAQKLREGTLTPNAKDALEFMKFLVEQLASKEDPAGRTQVIEGTASVVSGTDTEFLRRLAEAARDRVAGPGGLGEDPVGDSSRTRPN
jgi:hypothetical protein